MDAHLNQHESSKNVNEEHIKWLDDYIMKRYVWAGITFQYQFVNTEQLYVGHASTNADILRLSRFTFHSNAEDINGNGNHCDK